MASQENKMLKLESDEAPDTVVQDRSSSFSRRTYRYEYTQTFGL
jgi:hypothetical protein